MPKLDDIAAILWTKWGTTYLETLRQEASEAADGLAFRAMNTQGGIRTLLVVCTTDGARIKAVEETAGLGAVAHPVDWESYSAAEMVIKTEKRGGFRAPGTAGRQRENRARVVRDQTGLRADARTAVRPARMKPGSRRAK